MQIKFVLPFVAIPENRQWVKKFETKTNYRKWIALPLVQSIFRPSYNDISTVHRRLPLFCMVSEILVLPAIDGFALSVDRDALLKDCTFSSSLTDRNRSMMT